MGQIKSIPVETIIRSSILGGLVIGTIWTGSRLFSRPAPPPQHHSNDSFISFESTESANELLDFELQQTAQMIQSIKDLMMEGAKKRQLEESLLKAEMSFRDLFELKSRIGQEVAKSAQLRSSASKVILENINGDCSPFKRQRVETS